MQKNCHQCELCDKPLTDSELLLLDDMLETGYTITVDEKQALFYISGYIASKHPELASSPASSQLSKEVQAFLAEMNRGGLTYPSDNLFTFVVLAHSFSDKLQSIVAGTDLQQYYHSFHLCSTWIFLFPHLPYVVW
ncbi:hypothetical protein ElyMa_001684500 [Elysia marginata]|uniref:Uncharacterized protein n=1 Tax=Elysia marginata TaxID=1093978 RepID=A0AAV4JVC0_9GAST|nr:hypothetical protein ElyMa_001684500 [Elysia marginata]